MPKIVACLLFTSVVFYNAGGQIISTVAGNGTAGYNGDGITATTAQLNNARVVTSDTAGNLYIADWQNHRIRKVSNGIITTIAGTGSAGYNGDGIAATSAQLNNPDGVIVDKAGNVYIGDRENHRVRKIDKSTGLISTIAGTGNAGYNGDGIAATSAELNSPIQVALDASENIYVSEYNNHRIRKIDAVTGLISTIAGTGNPGYNGDGIAATAADLWGCHGVTVDGLGNIYIGDNYNHRVRKIDAGSGIISTIAGTGNAGFNGDGIDAATAELNEPHGVAIDAAGNVYIGDYWNHRVRKVDINTRLISTVAGTGSGGYNGDGISATAAQIKNPMGVFFDVQHCSLFIGDSENSRIRKVSFGSSLMASVTITTSANPFCSGSSVTFLATAVNGGSSPSYQWRINNNIVGTNSSSLSTSALNNNDTVTCLMTSSISCVNGSPATSNSIIMSVLNSSDAGNILAFRDTVCEGTPGNLSVTGSLGTLQWQSSSNGISFTDISGETDSTYQTDALLQSTYYRVKASGICGTDSSIALKLVVISLPVPSLSATDTIICSGDSAQVCVPNSFTNYQWNTGDTSFCTPAKLAGGYWLTVTDANGCSAISGHQNISVYPIPSVSIIVLGDTLSSFGAISYQWYRNDTLITSAVSALYIVPTSGNYSVQITDDNGCVATSTNVAVIKTGVDNIVSGSDIRIYPNPVGDVLSIQGYLANRGVLYIQDMLGQIVFTKDFSGGSIDLYLSKLNAGVYWLKMSDAHESPALKFVKR